MRSWIKLGTRTLFASEVLDLMLERLRSPRTAHELEAVVLNSADWVNVIPLTPAGDVVMIRQYRFASEEVTLEIPGGIVDPGEVPSVAALRELVEETGYESTRLTSLGSIAPNPAIHRNRLHCFLAEGCVLSGDQAQDPGEDIAVELVPLMRIDPLLATGEISHALVAVAFQKLALLRSGHTFG